LEPIIGFLLLLDKENPQRSWELKRNFALVFQKIDNFFGKETVSKDDEIVFTFGKKNIYSSYKGVNNNKVKLPVYLTLGLWFVPLHSKGVLRKPFANSGSPI